MTIPLRRAQDREFLTRPGAPPARITWSDAVTPSGRQERDDRARHDTAVLAERARLDQLTEDIARAYGMPTDAARVVVHRLTAHTRAIENAELRDLMRTLERNPVPPADDHHRPTNSP